MAGKVAAAREALECDLEELQRGYQEQVSWRGGAEGGNCSESSDGGHCCPQCIGVRPEISAVEQASWSGGWREEITVWDRATGVGWSEEVKPEG